MAAASYRQVSASAKGCSCAGFTTAADKCSSQVTAAGVDQTPENLPVNHIIKSRLVAAALATAFISSQSCSKGGTNEVGKLTMTATNSPAAKQPVWLADEKNVQGDKDTNGWACVLRISNQPWLSSQLPPVCSIIVPNISTNRLYCWGGLYGHTYSHIELVDAKGEPVEKTADGQQIGTRTNSAQIREMVKNRFKQWVHGRARTPGFIPVRPGQSGGIGFSIPYLFDIKQPGEYTLKAQVCLIQRVGGEEYDPEVTITWVPPVVAKFQIRPEVIPVRDSSLAQTNAPSK